MDSTKLDDGELVIRTLAMPADTCQMSTRFAGKRQLTLPILS